MFDHDRRKRDGIGTTLRRMVLLCLVGFLAYGGRTVRAGLPATGELQIAGGAVERLVLLDDADRERHFDQPARTILLPEGTYRLYEVTLRGGYVCRPHPTPDARSIRIESGRSAVLTLGAPLRQTVHIERRGTLMVLSYELLGRAGERYAVREGSAPPTVAILKGNRQIASGSFTAELGGAYSYLWRPPVGTSGVLRVVPSYDLGSLGPAEGDSTMHVWHWFHSIPGLPLWAALALTLVLAMILSKGNRTPWTLLILAPVAAVHVGWLAVTGALPLSPLELETLRTTILSLVVGMAVLWLIGRPLSNGAWVRSLPAAMGVAAGIVFLGTASLGLQPSDQMIRFVCVLSVLMSAAAVGYVAAGRTSGRRRRLRYFLLSLGAWTIAAAVAGMFVMIVIWCTTCGAWLGDADYILWLTFFVGPILGVCVFAMSLLFVIVGFRTRFSPPARLDTGRAHNLRVGGLNVGGGTGILGRCCDSRSGLEVRRDDAGLQDAHELFDGGPSPWPGISADAIFSKRRAPGRPHLAFQDVPGSPPGMKRLTLPRRADPTSFSSWRTIWATASSAATVRR